MDEFEVLTKSLGFKPPRKGAPMAASKARNNANTSQFQNSRLSSMSRSDLDSIFGSLHCPTLSSSLSGVDDADMLFDPGNKSFSKAIDDFFRSFESNSEQKATIRGFSNDDFKGGADMRGQDVKVTAGAADMAYWEELIPGFGGNSGPNSPLPVSHLHQTDDSIFDSESSPTHRTFSPLFSDLIPELNSSSKASSSPFGSSQANGEGSMEKTTEFVDGDINRWASGKQGNVVGAECGWKPVSMADLLASSSVNKFYKMAMLCVHPDKAQQRGANFQQMYTAQKVFHILKEAQNKFSKEELP